jgi:antitoxin component HigA of HigAB toxin-antitoxin module
MQALVKTHRTDIRMQGDIPARILDVLRSEYGGDLKVYEGDDEYVEATETDWYRNIQAQTTPGDAMRIYRENFGMTQAQLGEKLGNVPRQIVSNMERGRRPISLANAKKLAVIFNVPASRFLDL